MRITSSPPPPESTWKIGIWNDFEGFPSPCAISPDFQNLIWKIRFRGGYNGGSCHFAGDTSRPIQEVEYIMNHRRRDYAQALDLEYLNFEELGRSPVSKTVDNRIDDPAEKLPLPHFPALQKREGNSEKRELFSNQFGQDLA